MNRQTKSRPLLLGAGLVLGLTLGSVLSHSFFSSGNVSPTTPQSSQAAKSSNQRNGIFLPATHPVRRDLRALRESSNYATTATDHLRQERSPFRFDALLELQLEDGDFDLWEQRLASGEITTPDEYTRIAAWLAREDPQRALSLYFEYKIQFNTLDNRVAYLFSMLSTIASIGQSELVLEEVRKLPRGGTQQYHSYYLSRAWAEAYPAQAAQHFEELVSLRNLEPDRAAELNYKRYSKNIMSSWVKKNSEEARIFAENYPEGPGKKALIGSYTFHLKKEKKKNNQ